MNVNTGTNASYWVDMYTSWLSLAVFAEAKGDPGMTEFFLDQSENAEYMIVELNTA